MAYSSRKVTSDGLLTLLKRLMTQKFNSRRGPEGPRTMVGFATQTSASYQVHKPGLSSVLASMCKSSAFSTIRPLKFRLSTLTDSAHESRGFGGSIHLGPTR